MSWNVNPGRLDGGPYAKGGIVMRSDTGEDELVAQPSREQNSAKGRFGKGLWVFELLRSKLAPDAEWDAL